jgi:hypothetical protein
MLTAAELEMIQNLRERIAELELKLAKLHELVKCVDYDVDALKWKTKHLGKEKR